MKAIKHARIVDAEVEFLFDYSQRNSCRLDWDPFVTKVYLHDGSDMPSEGAEVTVRTWNRMSMTCRFVRFCSPECVAIKMLQGPGALSMFGASWRFHVVEQAATRVTFSYCFALKRGLRWLTPFAKAYFSWDMWRRLRALGRGAERAYAGIREGE